LNLKHGYDDLKDIVKRALDECHIPPVKSSGGAKGIIVILLIVLPFGAVIVAHWLFPQIFTC
jgi:hypothetical protein